jgi:hypothetical protein
MVSLPQLLHPCCRCYCATAHCATPCSPPLAVACAADADTAPSSMPTGQCSSLRPPSPVAVLPPPSSSSPHLPPIVAWEGPKSYPQSSSRWTEEDAAWPATVGEKNVPAMPSLFVVATSWVVNNDIYESTGWGCGSGGGGEGGRPRRR